MLVPHQITATAAGRGPNVAKTTPHIKSSSSGSISERATMVPYDAGAAWARAEPTVPHNGVAL